MRANQIKASEASNLSIARQVQRTLCGNVNDFAGACINQRGAERGNEREEIGHAGGTGLKHDERETTLQNVLLVFKPPVDGHEHLKASFACGAQQNTVLHTRPSERLHRRDLESSQVEKQVMWDGLIEEDAQSTLGGSIHTATSASSASRARPSDAWACSRVTLGN